MKTTKQDFALFQTYVSEWQTKLGLTNWMIYFDHNNIDDCYAQTRWSMSDSAATITLANKWDNMRQKTDDELKKLALHECLHILMAPFVAQAEARYTTQDSLDIAEHSIIRQLENVLA